MFIQVTVVDEVFSESSLVVVEVGIYVRTIHIDELVCFLVPEEDSSAVLNLLVEVVINEVQLLHPLPLVDTSQVDSLGKFMNRDLIHIDFDLRQSVHCFDFGLPIAFILALLIGSFDFALFVGLLIVQLDLVDEGEQLHVVFLGSKAQLVEIWSLQEGGEVESLLFLEYLQKVVLFLHFLPIKEL